MGRGKPSCRCCERRVRRDAAANLALVDYNVSVARVDAKTAIFWSIPIGIGVVAAFLGYRAFRERPWQPSTEPPVVVPLSPCGAGQYRCHEGKVEITTGDERDSGLCEWKSVAPCARACASSRVTLAGVDEATAKTQLCDPPRHLWRLVAEEKSFLDAPVTEAGVCEGDGYVPNEEGFVQCISRSGNDPSAMGVVLGKTTCRFGAVPTADRAPRLIKREEAIAVWCKRDPAGEPDAEIEITMDDAATDAATDADAHD